MTDTISIEFDPWFYDQIYEGMIEPKGKERVFIGDYDQSGWTAHVPLSLVETNGEERAFEQTTGFSRCHIIHWENEVDEAFYQPEDLPAPTTRATFQDLLNKHRRRCDMCRSLQARNDG